MWRGLAERCPSFEFVTRKSFPPSSKRETPASPPSPRGVSKRPRNNTPHFVAANLLCALPVVYDGSQPRPKADAACSVECARGYSRQAAPKSDVATTLLASLDGFDTVTSIGVAMAASEVRGCQCARFYLTHPLIKISSSA